MKAGVWFEMQSPNTQCNKWQTDTRGTRTVRGAPPWGCAGERMWWEVLGTAVGLSWPALHYGQDGAAGDCLISLLSVLPPPLYHPVCNAILLPARDTQHQGREDAFKSCTSARSTSGSSHHESWAEGCRMRKHPARISNWFWPLIDCNSPWILRLFPANWNDCGRTDFAATQTSLLSQRKSILYSFLQQVRWHQLCGWTNVLKTCQNS